MSEEAAKPDEHAPKKKGGSMLTMIIIVVVGLGAGAGGVFLGPMVMAKPAAAAEGAKGGHGEKAGGHEKSAKGKHGEHDSEEEEDEDEEEGHKTPHEAIEFDPLVVDTYSKDKTMHHVKAQIACEVAEGIKAEELKALKPRGREAALTYLRQQSFERLTDPAEFEKLKAELRKIVRKAMGKKHVTKVLIIDFVAQ